MVLIIDRPLYYFFRTKNHADYYTIEHFMTCTILSFIVVYVKVITIREYKDNIPKFESQN